MAGDVVRRIRRRAPKRLRVAGLRVLRPLGLWSRPRVPAAVVAIPRPTTPAAPAAPARSARRTFELAVPLPPRGGDDVEPAMVTSLHFDVPAGLYVPRVLQDRTLAGYEPHALAAFLAAVDQAPPGAVLDIGANIGLYALLAAAVGDRPVRAVEPTPELAQAARRLAADNGLEVCVDELALGEAEGTATLYLSDCTDSSNSLNPHFRAHSREIDVVLGTVDGYVEQTGAVPAVLKIDTETTEPQVIAGAGRTIAQHRPWMLVEVLHGRSEEALRRVLAPHGYTAYHLAGPGPRPVVEHIEGDPTSRHLMFLLAPHPVDRSFWDRMNAWQAALERVGHAAPGDARSTGSSAPRRSPAPLG